VSDQTLRRLIGMVAALLVAVVATGAVLGSRSVSADLRHRAETALTAAGLDDVRVDFRGREAELSGGNNLESRLARSLIGTLPGVRTIEAATAPDVAVPGRSSLAVDRAGDAVEISGVVSSPDDAAEFKVSVATVLRTTVIGDVTVDRSVGRADWADAVPDVVRAVAGVDGLALEVPGDGTVRVGGAVANAATRTTVLRRLVAALPDLELVETLAVASSRKGA